MNKFYACSCNFGVIPAKLECSSRKDTYKEADKYLDLKYGEPIDRNKTHFTTIIPLCKLFPDFVNIYRAKNKAENLFISK